MMLSIEKTRSYRSRVRTNRSIDSRNPRVGAESFGGSISKETHTLLEACPRCRDYQWYGYQWRQTTYGSCFFLLEQPVSQKSKKVYDKTSPSRFVSQL